MICRFCGKLALNHIEISVNHKVTSVDICEKRECRLKADTLKILDCLACGFIFLREYQPFTKTHELPRCPKCGELRWDHVQ